MHKYDLNVTSEGELINIAYIFKNEDVLDERAEQRYNKENTQGIAEFKIEEADGVRKVTSRVPDYPTLSAYLNKEFTKYEVLTILKNLMNTYAVGSQGIPVNCIVKDKNYIFIEPKTLATTSILIPVKEERVDMTEVPDFLRKIVSRMKFKAEDKDNYVARILTELNAFKFDAGRFTALVAEMLLDINAPVSEKKVGEAAETLAQVNEGNNIKINKMAVMMNRANHQEAPITAANSGQMNIGQPNPVNMGNPNPMNMGQPNPVNMGQPNPVNMGNPNPMNMGNPNPMNMGQPNQVNMGNPNSMNMGQPNPVNMGKPNPMNMGQPNPVNMGNPNPMNMGQPSQVNMGQPNPVNMGNPNQVNMGQPSQMNMGNPNPMNMADPNMPQPVFNNPGYQPSPANNAQLFRPDPIKKEMPLVQEAAKVENPAPEKLEKENAVPEQLKVEEPVAPAPEVKTVPEQAAAPAPEVNAAPVQEATIPDGPVSEKAPQILPESVAKATNDYSAYNTQPGKPVLQSGINMQAGGIEVSTEETEKLAQESIENQLRQSLGANMKAAPSLAATGDTSALLGANITGKPEPNFVRERTGERLFFTKNEFKIGKSRLHADYAIDGNTAISRIHCVIIKKNGVSYIRDNASTNGTYVNGEKLDPGVEVLLKDGTSVRLGDEEFTFHLRRY